MMKATITNFHGFLPHKETDHTETDMSKIIGAAHYSVVYDDGDTEALVTGLRPGENNAWNLKVIEAAQAWRDAGGEIPEWKEPTAEEIRAAMPALTARQFHLGLLNSGTASAEVQAHLNAIADPFEAAAAEIEWKHAAEFRRDHPLVETIGAALGYTPEVMDDLWEYFRTI
ncbi:hypothetical protein [Labrenzia sp. OB1]|uniref:hypothetical protein n=1 Tax=Labrenzia sp. OB1 TaxID=1561204 RepID=UPI000838B853|nr:hypothetical protein [Labrenzia sp. OB1]